jgi:predicted MFS family arabinose efflux permease
LALVGKQINYYFAIISIFQSYKNSFANLHKNVWLVSTVLFINRMGSMVILFTVLYFTSKLNYSKAEAGFIMSFFGIGSIFGSYIGGWLADRFNIKNIMLCSLVLSGCILIFINFTTNKYALMCILFFYALTADSFRPASSIAITAVSTPENRTRSISLMRLAINLGFSIGPAIGGIVAFHFGYKILFYIDSGTTFLAAIILFLFFPNVKTVGNKVKAMANLDVKTSAYRDKIFLIFIMLVAIYGLCFFQLFASVPTYLKQVCNYNEDTIGYILALNGLLVVIIEMPVIAYLEKFKKPHLYVLIGCLQIVIALGILMFSQGNLALVIVYTLFITLSEIFAMPFMMNFTLSRPIPERQGQYSALYSIGYGISIILAPSVGLYVAQHFGFDAMFILFMSLSVVVGFGMYRLLKK